MSVKEKYISIKGARVHNLKNIDVVIQHNKFIVITGVSGSGKSSLAYDTIYAEGQRRYVESLSSYARQFLGRMHKPEVDYIHGIAPAIAVQQKVISRSSRSTVGTSTEIYDYLKLLFARIGKTISPISGVQVKRHSVSDVVNFCCSLPEQTQITILSPIRNEVLENSKAISNHLKLLQQQGFSKVQINAEVIKIDDLILTASKNKIKIDNFRLIIDRIVLTSEEEIKSRIADSAQTAFFEGAGECLVEAKNNSSNLSMYSFNNRFEVDGIVFEEPSVHLFSFNNPIGACKTCEGFGSIIGMDENLIIPNKNLSVFQETIACWRGEKMSAWKEELIKKSLLFDFPIHRPYFQLSEKEKKLLWTGNEHFDGLNAFFKFLEQESFKIQYRVMLARYRGKTICTACNGSRLKKESDYVKIAAKSIGEIVSMQIKDAILFFKNLSLDEKDKEIAKRILIEITSRFNFLSDVGLGYLTLNRLSNTLSGGESQRINLATSLGSSLVGSMYVLDEPSIGLHPRDTQRLIKVLQSLKAIGNTLLIVEHDEEIMLAADEIIDLGPGAGRLGGEIVFQGNAAASSRQQAESRSYTVNYLNRFEKIPIPLKRRKWKNYIEVKNTCENNLKNINVKFPLGVLTAVTGVSGSGKTTLVKKVFYTSLKRRVDGFFDQNENNGTIAGDVNKISSVEMVDQNPIGKSSRSNPVTYIKAYDEIRNLFSDQPLSKLRRYKPSSFSFNVDGGRCETCEGEGEVTIEMQFMAEVHLTCETCKGKRFKDDVLEVELRGKNIYNILELTVDDAITFFEQSVEKNNYEKRISFKLKLLQEVGLGYIHLGQSSSTLSGGEAQRVKLATFLLGNIHTPVQNGSTVFIFDEPTTGLHFHDIKKLLIALNRLVEEGNSVIIIEHNPDIIKCADWVIDLGPEGGDEGGNLVFAGTPDDLINCKESITGKFIRKKLRK